MKRLPRKTHFYIEKQVWCFQAPFRRKIKITFFIFINDIVTDIGSNFRHFADYPGSQAPFLGEEVTSPAIVDLNTILVRLCHPIEGLGGDCSRNFFGAMVKLHIVSCYLSCLRITNVF